MEGIYTSKLALERHAAAPMREEREKFIRFRAQQGIVGKVLQSDAAWILQGVYFLNLDAPRIVTAKELDEAIERWSSDAGRHPFGMPGKHALAHFEGTVRKFLRFSDLLELPKRPFDAQLQTYLGTIAEQRCLVSMTIKGYEKQLRPFFAWLAKRSPSLHGLSHEHLSEYLRYKSSTTVSTTLLAIARTLKRFILFGEEAGWFTNRLHTTIQLPACRYRASADDFPSWKDVRRLLDADLGTSPSAYRGRAMLLLCSVYGLRSSEVMRLKLTDFDWVEETMTVKRAKGGRIQLFPLQYEVGEAILNYIAHGRPRCSCTEVFVSLTHPYRPPKANVINEFVRELMMKFDIKCTRRGPHSLRHACATELLRTGTSLRQIANFLGHKNLQTVSVYAHSDLDALREVAKFRFKDVL